MLHAVIQVNYLLGGIGNAFDVFLFLCGKPQHEIKLYFIPAAGKGFTGAFQNILLCQPLVDHITHSLGTGLRCEGQAALFDILNLTHNVQRKGIDTERRKGNVDPLTFTVIDEEVYDTCQIRIVTRT